MSGAARAAVLAAVAVLGSGGAARADGPVTRPEAIDVDRDATPPGQAELAFDGGAPIGTWALGVTFGYLDRPLELHTLVATGYPVDHRETAELGGAIALGDRVIVDARLPLSHQIGTRFQGFGDDRPLDPWVRGDLQIGARVQVATAGPVSIFLRGDVALPTGNDYELAGDAGWSATWLGIARLELPHGLVIAGTGGFHLRETEVQVENELVGDELVWGLGAAIGIPPGIPVIGDLWCEPDQLRASLELDGVVGDRVSASHGPSPAEVKVGLIGRVRPQYAIAVRVGTHLDEQIGAPEFRATIDVVYQASPARAAKPAARAAASQGDDDSDDE